MEREKSAEVKGEEESEATAERADAGEAIFAPRSSCVRKPRAVAQPCVTHPENHESGGAILRSGKN